MYYLKGRLQPTRSLGDYYLKKAEYYSEDGEYDGPYLSCEPKIDEHIITKAHRFMVIASDGLWDVLTRQEVMNTLMEEP